MSRFYRLIKSKKTAFVAGLVVAAVSLTSITTVTVHKVAAADCDSNAIMYCGFSDPRDFINKVRNNDSGNGHHDLQNVYGGYDLPSGEYDNFAANAKAGTAYKDGRIVVDGKTIATNSRSIGREASAQGPGYYSQVVGGITYYGNTNSRAFASDGLPVYVLFDAQGKMRFAVLKACGNPMAGDVVQTAASCSALQSTPVSGKLNTYKFTASAAASGNATITKYVYDFGDGTGTVTMNDGSTPVEHTYGKAGKFTASVTVYASVPGNSNLKLSTVSLCTKVITVAMPFYKCMQLTGAILDKDKYEYSFTATASYGNGASFTGADFTFGDGKSQNGVKPNGSAVSVTHTYAQAGKYNIAATLHFNVGGKDVTAPTCTASVTPTTPPTPTCKPGVPVGSPECSPPCTEGSTTPPGSAECQPPALPNTGAGNVVAIFAGVAVVGFLVYRQLLFRKHKAAFLAAERGSSPLPLGDPLSDQPLVGTPLEPHHRRKTFRRKRQF